MIKICVLCGKPFEVDDTDRNRNRRRYCGLDCADQAAYLRKKEYAKNGKKKARDVKCEICGKIFRTSYSQKVTCSMECKYERSKRLSRENDRQRREAIMNGTLPKPERKKPKQKKVETLAEFNRKAREMGMSYGEYDKHLRIQAMQKERAQNGGC